ncbi:MAG TPA: YoaK family protein [Candidatus Acidoferrales bacterium]|nr:YoaK family protein [Candidatus Acidoferrales bacterium]
MKNDHYALMPLLFGLTLVSGLIDAVSFLHFNHVFVANMTGNVVLLGFAVAGAKGISIPLSLTAIASFMLGALFGGRLSRRYSESGAHVLSVATVAKIFLMLAAAVVAAIGTGGGFAYAILALLGVSMGLQNAVVRAMAVPDITTTVVTQTITGIAADSTLAGGTNTRLRRRIATVVIMFAGALLGALVLFAYGPAAAVGTAAFILAVLSGWAWRLRGRAV